MTSWTCCTPCRAPRGGCPPGQHRCGCEQHECCYSQPCPIPCLGWPPFILLRVGVMGRCDFGLGSACQGDAGEGRRGCTQHSPTQCSPTHCSPTHLQSSHPTLSHPTLSHAGVMFPAPIDLIGQSHTWQLERKVPIFQTQTGRFINHKNIQSPSPSKACNLFYSRQPNFI